MNDPEMRTMFADAVAFVAHDLLPDALRRTGPVDGTVDYAGLADQVAGTDLCARGGDELDEVLREVQATLRARRRELAQTDGGDHARAPFPSEWHQIEKVLSVLLAVMGLHHSWFSTLESPDAGHEWAAARSRIARICAGLQHQCDRPLRDTARLLATSLPWHTTAEVLDGLDGDSAERLCRLGEAGAFRWTYHRPVVEAARELSDEMCTLACGVIKGTLVHNESVLVAARRSTPATFRAAARLFTAARSYHQGRDGSRGSGPRRSGPTDQELFAGAFDVADGLDDESCELAAQLVARGRSFDEAVGVARVAVGV